MTGYCGRGRLLFGLRIAATICVAASCAVTALAQPADADRAYLDYLAEFKSGAALEKSKQRGGGAVEVGLRLRHLYSRTSFYKPYSDPSDSLAREAGAHRAAGRFAECVKSAEAALAITYTNLAAHFLATRCSASLGDAAATQRLMTPFVLQIGAILREPGRDGRSPDTSWRAISVSEQYVILGYLGLATTSKSLVADSKGEMNDCHTIRPDPAKADASHPKTLCFNVSLPMSKIGEEFGLKKK